MSLNSTLIVPFYTMLGFETNVLSEQSNDPSLLKVQHEQVHTVIKFVDEQRLKNTPPHYFEREKSVLICYACLLSVDHTDVQYTELGSTGGAGDSAGQPGFGSLLVLAAGEPSTQTGQTPHGSAETLLALWLVVSSFCVAESDQFGVCLNLHTSYTGFHLLSTGECVCLIEVHLSSKCIQEEFTDGLVDHYIGRVSDGNVELLPELCVLRRVEPDIKCFDGRVDAVHSQGQDLRGGGRVWTQLVLSGLCHRHVTFTL